MEHTQTQRLINAYVCCDGGDQHLKGEFVNVHGGGEKADVDICLFLFMSP
jgi:hypothetical protein